MKLFTGRWYMRKQGHHIDVFQATENREISHSEWEEIEEPVFTKKPKTLESAKVGDKVLHTRCDMLYVVLFVGEDFVLVCPHDKPARMLFAISVSTTRLDFCVVDTTEG
jgi:hypothetical protein